MNGEEVNAKREPDDVRKDFRVGGLSMFVG